jgi:hypothetical protein
VSVTFATDVEVLEELATLGAGLVRALDALADGDSALAYSIVDALEQDVARWFAAMADA